MTAASYNETAEWYDEFLRTNPVYAEVILPNLLALVGEVRGAQVIGRLVTGYFDERAWLSANPQGVRSRVADHHRMLGTYLNSLSAAGFVFERALEPGPSARQAERVPGNRESPTLLLLRAHVQKGATEPGQSHRPD